MPLNCMIHEFSNIIAILEANIALLTRHMAQIEVKEDTEILKRLKNLDNSSQRLKLLIKNLATEVDHTSNDDCPISEFDTLETFFSGSSIFNLLKLHGIDMSFDFGTIENQRIVANIQHLEFIVENLISNASFAKATRMSLTVVEHNKSLDFVFRDNGFGIADAEAMQVGFGYTAKNDSNHGNGYRLKRILASKTGGLISQPKSIPGFATEITLTLMKAGNHPACGD